MQDLEQAVKAVIGIVYDKSMKSNWWAYLHLYTMLWTVASFGWQEDEVMGTGGKKMK